MKAARHNNTLFAATRSTGFSLVEVLVALVVISIGLIGLAAIQQAGVRNNHNALLHAQASMLAYEISDFMRSNREAIQVGHYSVSAPPTGTIPQCASVESTLPQNCTAADIATFHLDQWYRHLQDTLPQGSGSIACEDGNTADTILCSRGSVLSISVSWAESDIGGSEEMNFVTEVQF